MKIKKLVASIMAIATISTCAFAAVGCKEKETEKEAAYTQQGGAVIMDGESNGISFMSTTIAQEDYDEYGVSATAESAVQLSVQVENVSGEPLSDSLIDWSVSFKNAASTWATGKTVTDYVTVTPTAQGAHSAVVECRREFGEQIIVKAAYAGNASVYGTKNIDYEYRITDLKSVSFGFDSFESDTIFSGDTYYQTTAFSYETVSNSAYTVAMEEVSKKAYVSFDSELIDFLKNGGEFDISHGEEFFELECSGDFVMNLLSAADRLSVNNDDAYYKRYWDSIYYYLTEMAGEAEIGRIRVIIESRTNTYTRDYALYFSPDVISAWQAVVSPSTVSIEGEDVIF